MLCIPVNLDVVDVVAVECLHLPLRVQANAVALQGLMVVIEEKLVDLYRLVVFLDSLARFGGLIRVKVELWDGQVAARASCVINVAVDPLHRVNPLLVPNHEHLIVII